MRLILGIDTSNYTTSAALTDADSGALVKQVKQLLPVKDGALGVRQSEAVFLHTKALPALVQELYHGIQGETVAVCVSTKPSEQPGSYMPCFLAGLSAAGVSAQALQVPLFETSHQAGHVLACLYACDALSCLEHPLICFHVSGGTTDALLVQPSENLLKIRCVASSMDLKAGQAVDRIGVHLGCRFPAGKELEALALCSKENYRQKSVLNEGNCSFSGLQNLAQKMYKEGASKEDCAKFTFDYIANTLCAMSARLLQEYGELPLFFAGGVMSNSIIRQRLEQACNARFCPPEFSADNAAGIAVYGYLKWKSLKN